MFVACCWCGIGREEKSEGVVLGEKRKVRVWSENEEGEMERKRKGR